MNERIRQLAEQAGLKIPVDTEYNGHIYRNDLEKFARLIVQECALTAALMEHNGRKNIGAAILDSFEIPVVSNVIAGADQMAGDGGYQISTREAYEEFVEKRNGG
jgi:hypothetical protein